MEEKAISATPAQTPDEFTLEFILPFSKKKVKITAPTWGDRKRAKASSKNMGGDGDDTVEIMLAGCTEIDGKPVDSPLDFEKLHVHDFSEILAKFGAWEVDDTGKAKNV